MAATAKLGDAMDSNPEPATHVHSAGNDDMPNAAVMSYAMRLIPREQPMLPDSYFAFRGVFELEHDAEISLDIFGAHWFTVRLDGDYLTEGPHRFPADHPEYEIQTIRLRRGRHLVAAEVRQEGVATRMLRTDLIPAFFLCRVRVADTSIPVHWKQTALNGYVRTGQRVNPQFAWMEWVDTRVNPADWQAADFDETGWETPEPFKEIASWPVRPLATGPVLSLDVKMRRIGEGKLSGPFDGAERPNWKTDDDLTWFRRDLNPDGPADGVWRRYDLGYVMLGRPEIRLDVPTGSIVEIAYSEALHEGKVTPYINLSAGLSRNLDHFVARGGVQSFAPQAPKGGRFLEVHVQADPSKVRFVRESFRHRTYFDEPTGEFRCGDERLNRIWRLGIDTLRACSEDAVVDNPTRERGQWLGDVLLATYIAAAGYNDLRLFRRSLEQSAYCAEKNGLVAGLNPGGPSFLSTYAAQWFTAVVNYFDLTGDRTVLEALYPYAERNMAAFLRALGPKGISNDLAWAFVDWGYPGTPNHETDIALNLHVLEGVRSLQTWAHLLNKDPAQFADIEQKIKTAVLEWLAPLWAANDWETIGYHRAILALRSNLIPAEHRQAAIDAIKRHMGNCFPNNPAAPRLASPDVKSAQLITPYFAAYAFPALIAAGEMDFVLEQYRVCWGWGLDNGLTTQPEVFDLNWSHSHIWASCPTAQLTKYVLGIEPRYSRGDHHFDLTLNPGSLKRASGVVPFPNREGGVTVDWKREERNTIALSLRSAVPVVVHLATAESVRIEGQGTVRLRLGG